MSVVKDVDLEAMPTSIFINDDDDDGFEPAIMWRHCSDVTTLLGGTLVGWLVRSYISV